MKFSYLLYLIQNLSYLTNMYETLYNITHTPSPPLHNPSLSLFQNPVNSVVLHLFFRPTPPTTPSPHTLSTYSCEILYLYFTEPCPLSAELKPTLAELSPALKELNLTHAELSPSFTEQCLTLAEQ